jgi:hypothetical protein
MNKSTHKDHFLDFAYSPIDNEFKQRIIYPKRKKIIINGIRYLKELNENEFKINRKKSL